MVLMSAQVLGSIYTLSRVDLPQSKRTRVCIHKRGVAVLRAPGPVTEFMGLIHTKIFAKSDMNSVTGR